MEKIYIDATQPLRWGPQPAVGIHRVESALIRQALRQNDLEVEFFLVEHSGESRLLSADERRYVEDLVHGHVAGLDADGGSGWYRRFLTALTALRGGAVMSGREFDRVAAAYVSRSANRKGIAYQFAKAALRATKLCIGSSATGSRSAVDPLADPTATCFLSSTGVHWIAAKRPRESVRARISVVLHDLIPLESPRFFSEAHAAKFSCDFDWMLHSCRQIICTSDFTARTLEDLFKGMETRAAAPAIMKSELGSFLRDSLGSEQSMPVAGLEGEKFAVYCSTIEIRKNHIMLLRVWERLMPLLGERLPRLICCGRWGWKYEEVTTFLEAYPEVARKVSFVSDLGDRQLAWLYENAMFGLFPSFTEGWGLGASECLSFGLPVLISDAPALAEATQGLMHPIPANNLNRWCEMVMRASTDAQWRSTMRSRIALNYRPVSESRFARRLMAVVATSDNIRAVREGAEVALGEEFDLLVPVGE